MSDLSWWQQYEARLRATWTAETTNEERVRLMTVLLRFMGEHAVIGEGRALAEEAFELALGDDVGEAIAGEAFLCLGDVYDELYCPEYQEVAAERWMQRFGSTPPVPVFGLSIGNDGSVDVLTSRDDVE